MRKLLAIAAGLMFICGITTAQAFVNVDIDLSTQRMNVVSSQGSYSWPISSARRGYFTPNGSFGVQRLEAMHYSRLYDNSPMPHSIFFSGGFAIHGTYATGALGRPASHGCVRLAPGNAATLYSLIQREGGHITIHGAPPASRAIYAKSTHHGAHHYARAKVPRGDYYGYAASSHAPPSTTLGFDTIFN